MTFPLLVCLLLNMKIQQECIFLDLQFKKTEISSGNYYFLILCSEINNN